MRNFLIALIAIVMTACETQNPEHFEPSYNQEVDKDMFKLYFPKQQNQSIVINGDQAALKPKCPLISEHDRFINIEYDFTEEMNVKDIALLNVFIHKKEYVNNKWEWKGAVDKYFLPYPYSNKILVKNYFPKGEYRLWYGYYLKKDSVAEYPRFYKTTCHLTID